MNFHHVSSFLDVFFQISNTKTGKVVGCQIISTIILKKSSPHFFCFQNMLGAFKFCSSTLPKFSVNQRPLVTGERIQPFPGFGLGEDDQSTSCWGGLSGLEVEKKGPGICKGMKSYPVMWG